MAFKVLKLNKHFWKVWEGRPALAASSTSRHLLAFSLSRYACSIRPAAQDNFLSGLPCVQAWLLEKPAAWADKDARCLGCADGPAARTHCSGRALAPAASYQLDWKLLGETLCRVERARTDISASAENSIARSFGKKILFQALDAEPAVQTWPGAAIPRAARKSERPQVGNVLLRPHGGLLQKPCLHALEGRRGSYLEQLRRIESLREKTTARGLFSRASSSSSVRLRKDFTKLSPPAGGEFCCCAPALQRTIAVSEI